MMHSTTMSPSHSATSQAPHAQLNQVPSDRRGLAAAELEHFLHEYVDRLTNVARRYFRCEEDIADAVQDTLLAAFRARHTFDAESTVYTWLHRILVNNCLMALRSRSRMTLVSLDTPAGSIDVASLTDTLSSHEASPDNSCEAAEITRFVHTGIAQLPAKYREVLTLRDIKQLDTFETARILQLSPAAVKTRLHRARRSLQKTLAPHFLQITTTTCNLATQ